ncbi:MAG TPA: cellulose biosynthesis protein BcsG, partial [Limnobacter sp.]|nr:cellulose biosynthesis protein BcsG [Limnobacter sp.]
MLVWNLYFLIKIGLHLAGQIMLSPVLNLVLFAALVISNPAFYVNRRLLKVLRYAVFTGPAIALLLHECGLTVSLALIDQIKALFGFSTDYLWELVKRTIQPWMLWGALLAFMLVQVFDRYLRTSAWVGLGLLGIWLLQAEPQRMLQGRDSTAVLDTQVIQTRENLSPAELLALGQVEFQKLEAARNPQDQSVDPDEGPDTSNPGNGPTAVLNAFFEQQRKLSMKPFSPATSPDFDVIVLQVCSLSWADLQHAKQARHPALQQADFIFENFNSATSYSGPAAIRLLRGKCGQSPHDELYRPADSSCMLFQQLRSAGFAVEMGLNHDGLFQDFAKLVKTNLGAEAVQRVQHDDVAAGVVAFDGSKVGRDGDYLRAWWNGRLEKGGA